MEEVVTDSRVRARLKDAIQIDEKTTVEIFDNREYSSQGTTVHYL